MTWQKNAEDTLTVAGDTIDTGTYTSFKFNQFMIHALDTGGTITTDTEFNSTAGAGTKYAERTESNGGADGTSVSRPDWETGAGGAETADKFVVGYYINIDGEEKLGICSSISENVAGAGNIPERRDLVGKFVETSDVVITSQQVTNPSAGNFDIDSNLSVLSTN